MTERGVAAVTRDACSLAIGPSWLSWDGTALTFWIDEVTAPWPSRPLPARVRGKVKVTPEALTGRRFVLDRNGRHRWWPIAPCSHIEVELERPALSWSGSGYLDTNDGDEPLEAGFGHWDWARASLRGGKEAALLYDVVDRRGGRSNLALHTDASGRLSEVEPQKPVPLPRTLWRMPRATRAEDEGGAKVAATLEDTPFYARSLLSTKLFGETAPAIHESLSLDRFRTPIVKMMLPYRMPRR